MSHLLVNMQFQGMPEIAQLGISQGFTLTTVSQLIRSTAITEQFNDFILFTVDTGVNDLILSWVKLEHMTIVTVYLLYETVLVWQHHVLVLEARLA